jgi:hypothetical protein
MGGASPTRRGVKYLIFGFGRTLRYNTMELTIER